MRTEYTKLYAEYRHYFDLRMDIEDRAPNYMAIVKNLALDQAGAMLSVLGHLFMLGGLRIYFDFGKYKSLPYKVPV